MREPEQINFRILGGIALAGALLVCLAALASAGAFSSKLEFRAWLSALSGWAAATGALAGALLLARQIKQSDRHQRELRKDAWKERDLAWLKTDNLLGAAARNIQIECRRAIAALKALGPTTSTHPATYIELQPTAIPRVYSDDSLHAVASTSFVSLQFRALIQDIKGLNEFLEEHGATEPPIDETLSALVYETPKVTPLEYDLLVAYVELIEQRASNLAGLVEATRPTRFGPS